MIAWSAAADMSKRPFLTCEAFYFLSLFNYLIWSTPPSSHQKAIIKDVPQSVCSLCGRFRWCKSDRSRCRSTGPKGRGQPGWNVVLCKTNSWCCEKKKWPWLPSKSSLWVSWSVLKVQSHTERWEKTVWKMQSWSWCKMPSKFLSFTGFLYKVVHNWAFLCVQFYNFLFILALTTILKCGTLKFNCLLSNTSKAIFDINS